jgi:hypothetical protein
MVSTQNKPFGVEVCSVADYYQKFSEKITFWDENEIFQNFP